MKIIFILILFLALSGCKKDTLNNKYSNLISNLPVNEAPCESNDSNVNFKALHTERCNWLSNYNLFININSETLEVNGQGISYELNSTLFTDFSDKFRFMFIPDKQSLKYEDKAPFNFPIGSTLVKVFSLSAKNENRIIEVRLAINRENGWVFLPYIWDEALQDAFFHREGYKLDTQVESNNQLIDFTYEIPSSSNCLECHRSELKTKHISIQPIAPKARHLNKIIDYQGNQINQLTLWKNLDLLTNLPDDLSQIDTAPDWRDESAPLQNRAKGYLDINCAHCHSDGGSAALSGLRLEYWRKSITHSHGVCNSSHGWRGGGFDIWPGRGDISSIPIRMNHTASKDRMPPIGRTLIDQEAVKLIRSWIDSMPYQSCSG